MPSYDEDRSSVHTDLEQAAKESVEKANERYQELQANRAIDVNDPAQALGREYGYAGAAFVDPEVRANIDALGEDPLATGAVVSPRQSGTGEWEVHEENFGGAGGGGATPTQAKRSSRAKSSEAESS